MYFMPLSGQLNAFDRALITNEKFQNELAKFNTDYLNSNQFVNLINNFCNSNFFQSEVDTNKLISYLKNNFNESQLEKNIKLEYVCFCKMYFLFLFLNISMNIYILDCQHKKNDFK